MKKIVNLNTVLVQKVCGILILTSICKIENHEYDKKLNKFLLSIAPSLILIQIIVNTSYTTITINKRRSWLLKKRLRQKSNGQLNDKIYDTQKIGKIPCVIVSQWNFI